MACNCLCCGCQNCTEGQEGKCCCGGSSGSCCQPGEYCCSGVCVEGGCVAGACCVNGVCSEAYADQAACEADDGVWYDGALCSNNPCCVCQDGTATDEFDQTIPPTECSSPALVCIQYTYSGEECPPGAGNTYKTTTGLIFRPCSAVGQVRAGVRLFLCGIDGFDLTGEASCSTVVYDENCDCVATDCDWVNVVGEWANLYGGSGQCDCALELLSYTILQDGTGVCP